MIDPHPHPSTEGYPLNTLTPFWGPPCCSAIPRKDCRGVLQPARNMAFQRTLQSSEVTAPKTQGGGWSLGGGRIARPHHTPRHLHLKVIEDSKGQGQDHHKHSWNKSRPGAQEKLPKVFWGMHVYVFSFRCIHVNFILFSCEVGIMSVHFRQTNWCPGVSCSISGHRESVAGPLSFCLGYVPLD